MKKISTLFFAISIFVLSANAQFEKGSFLAGGSVAFSSQSYSSGPPTGPTRHQTNITLTPSVGYFILNNLALGAGVSFTHAHESNLFWYDQVNQAHKYSYNTSGLSFSPFARYYVNKAFVHANYNVGTTRTSFSDNHYARSDARTYGFATGVGYAILLNKNVAIEPMVGYLYQHSGPKGTDFYTKTDEIFLRIGFQIYLNKKN